MYHQTYLVKSTEPVLTIFRCLGVLFIVHDVEIEAEQINGDGVLSRKVLLHASQERLCKEEARHPEGWRRTVVEPFLSKNETSH